MVSKIKKKTKETEIENPEDQNASRNLDLVREILENTQAHIKKALSLLKEKDVDTGALLESLQETKAVSNGFITDNGGDQRIIEGVFSGEKMISGDGNEYNVPANYASKSKLVEGDILKLTISKDGSFIYKQIGPVERKQLVAALVEDEAADDLYALADNKRWKLLTASVTYFHGTAGDEVVILVPKDGVSKWAAVENIIKVNR